MEARVGEERGRGIPLSDVERVMRHYNIDEATARYYLSVHPIEILLPERGYGLTEAIQPPISGPRPIGQLAAVAVGAYTDIVAIYGPAEAKAGETVNLQVDVRNLHTEAIYIAVTGRYNGTDIYSSPDYLNVGAGAIASFTLSFTMPSNDIRVDIWSLYWAEPEWYADDSGTASIALTEAVEPYAGTISRRELKYDAVQAAIPAYNIPQGKEGQVHIWGRNNMSTSQKMAIYWIVRAPPGYPDGPILEEYYDEETFSTGPGGEHEFIGGRFPLDKIGTYDIRCGLLMNPDNPVYVDIYYGDLCTVAAAVPEPQFRGFGVREYQTV